MKSPSNLSGVRLTQQVFSPYGFTITGAQTTLPTDTVPENIKNIKLLREAYHSL